MTDDTSPSGPADQSPASGGAPGHSPQAGFEVLPPGEHGPAIVRAAGDIDLTNAGQFHAALDQAAVGSGAVTADMTAATYCDSAAIRALCNAARQISLTIQVSAGGPLEPLLKVSGLDQIATIITR